MRLRFWRPKPTLIELVKAFDWEDLYNKTPKGEAVVAAFRAVLEQYGPDIGYNPTFTYEEIVNYLLTLCDILEEASQKAIDALEPLRDTLFDWLSKHIKGLPRWLFDFVYDTILLNLYDLAKQGFNWLRGKMPSFVAWAKAKAESAWAWLKEKLGKSGSTLKSKAKALYARLRA